jgi:ketosteroid isomerase-like protein
MNRTVSAALALCHAGWIQWPSQLQTSRRTVSVFLAALTFSVGVAQAQDRHDVLQAVDAVRSAWNTRDVDAIQKYYAFDFTRYDASGKLLRGEWDWAGLKDWFEWVPKYVISKPDLSGFSVHGNTAIVIYRDMLTASYGLSENRDSVLWDEATGPMSLVESYGTAMTTKTFARRITSIWVKRANEWKCLHQHESLLTEISGS